MKTIPSIMRPRARPAPQARGLTGGPNALGGLGIAAPSVAGVLVTPQTALTYTAVFAGINVISRDFASLQPRVFRRNANGGKRELRDHPAAPILAREPDPSNRRGTSLRFRQALMGHALAYGNGFAQIDRTPAGDVRALRLLDPGRTRPKETPGGRLYYELEDGSKLLPESVLHMAGLGFDGVTGYSAIRLATEAIGLGKAAEQFGASIFGNGAIPHGMLKTSKRLKESAVRNLRSTFEGRHGGARQANRIAILEDGIEWVPTQINPDQAQFLATRAFQVLEVARVLSIPPHKIGDYSQSHLANVEESNLDYLTTTMAGWVGAFEAECNLKLLSADEAAEGVFIACDMTALLRGNMRARIDYYKGMRELGVVNADDIAVMENRNPVGKARGGKKYLVQANLTTLDKAGDPGSVPGSPQASTPPAPGAPPAEGEGPAEATPTDESTSDE